jgi:glycosyltransferase involved in cell wall biosynthesis
VTVVISTLSVPPSCTAASRRAARLHASDEIVVVDQGTRAATAAVLDQLGAGVPVQHVVQPRRGLSASQNAGVQAAGSPVVAVVDDDCVPGPEWLTVVQREFAAATTPLLLTGSRAPLPPHGATHPCRLQPHEHRPAEWHAPAPPWDVGTGGNFAVTPARPTSPWAATTSVSARGTSGRGGNDLDLFHRLS